MRQMEIVGADWLSGSERKANARAEVHRKKAALECIKKLNAAARALTEFSMACSACNDASALRGADDSRTILASNMWEYATWLDSMYGKDG